MMTQTFLVLCLAAQGLLMHVAGSAPLPARPPLGKHVGFISKGNSAKIGSSSNNSRSRSDQGRLESPLLSAAPSVTVTSAGIRSACARDRAATPRRRGETSASAATRLRGGSWGPGYTPFVPQLLHAADKPKERISYDRLDSCTERDTAHGAGGGDGVGDGRAQLTTSKQRLVEEEEAEDSVADSSADADGMGGSGGGGGGGGGRVGTLPSFPRSFSAGTAKAAAVNKKFAWVP